MVLLQKETNNKDINYMDNNYEATFTLIQDGIDGDIYPYLELKAEAETEEPPVIHTFLTDVFNKVLDSNELMPSNIPVEKISYSKDNQYKASFSLAQEDLEGEVTPTLSMDPLVNPTEDEVPVIYEEMSNLALEFLRYAGIIDDNYEYVEEEFADKTILNVSRNNTPSSGTTKH